MGHYVSQETDTNDFYILYGTCGFIIIIINNNDDNDDNNNNKNNMSNLWALQSIMNLGLAFTVL